MKPEEYFTVSLDKPIKLGEMQIIPVWFDSMGAKSMCTFVRTPDVKIIIDPGAAIMQGSYPMEESNKEAFLDMAMDRVKEFSKKADITIITHYHYDHHARPEDLPESYINKQVYIKNPNKWINYSQWNRARLIYEDLIKLLNLDISIDEFRKEPENEKYQDPYKELNIARNKNFGSYQDRREELLDKWRSTMKRRINDWKEKEWLMEFSEGGTAINFIKEGTISYGDNTEIEFTKPLFHGIEYAKTGWVQPVLIRYGDKLFLHTSDLHGPMIEDYAEWIIDLNPDVLILDGPATYLFGYLLNRTNLERSIENVSRILNECDFQLMIYDHHNLREGKFREHMNKYYRLAGNSSKKAMTAAEWYGLKPLAELLEDLEESR